MNFSLQRKVNIGHRVLECWVEFQDDEDAMWVASVRRNGRDVTRRVQGSELKRLEWTVTVADYLNACKEARDEDKIERLG